MMVHTLINITRDDYATECNETRGNRSKIHQRPNPIAQKEQMEKKKMEETPEEEETRIKREEQKKKD